METVIHDISKCFDKKLQTCNRNGKVVITYKIKLIIYVVVSEQLRIMLGQLRPNIQKNV